MRQRHQIWLARSLVVLLIGVAGVSALLAQTNGDTPVPIQRILLPPERLAKELEKVPQGGLVRLPLADFDARLDRIRKIMPARGVKPRLTHARYRAELIDGALQNGVGEWTLHHAAETPAVLPLEPMNLALGHARWKSGAAVLLAEFEGKSLGLIVPPGAAQTCMFAWSAHGTLLKDGISFALTTPTCPIATFDLTLPADYWLTAAKGIAVAGPNAAESPDKRLWQIQVTGATSFDITARKIASGKGVNLALFSQVHAIEKVTSDVVEVEHTFQIDILHGSLRELFLDGDSALQPFEVTLRSGEIKAWHWSLAKKDAKGKTPASNSGVLRLEFDHAVLGKVQDLRVRSLVSRPVTGTWTSPGLRVRNAYSRGETLEVHLPGDSPPGHWDHGAFTPVNISTEGGGKQVLTLVQTSNEAASRRPSVIFAANDKAMLTREDYEWRLAPRGADLKADIVFAPTRGHFFELAIKTPPVGTGYAVESVAVQPTELMRGWHFAGDVVIVELKQPLTPGKRAIVKLHLAAQYREIASANRFMTNPDLTPIDASKREGTLAVLVDSKLQAHLVGSSLPLVTSEKETGTAPRFRFNFRDQKLTATIRLAPQQAALVWHGKNTVTLREDKATLRFHWEVTPQLGFTEMLDFRFSPGFPAVWRIYGESGAPAVHHWERLHVHEALPFLLHLGAQHRLQSAALDAALPAGTLWRVHLAEPLGKKATYVIEGDVPIGLLDKEVHRLSLHMPRAGCWEWVGSALAHQAMPTFPGKRIWQIPLATPVQSSRGEQQISVDSLTEPIQSASAGEFRLARPTGEKNPFHLQLQQSADGPLPYSDGVHLVTLPERRSTSALERCDEASITSYVLDDGAVYHCIRFQLWNWRESVFALHLPAGNQALAVKLQDRWLDRIASEEKDGPRLLLPFDQNSTVARYEVYIRQTSARQFWRGFMKLDIPQVHWPVAPLDLRTRVFLQNAWTPLWRQGATPVGLPARIGDRSRTLGLLQQAWSFGEEWWPTSGAAQLAEKLEQQKQVVLAAEVQLRRAGQPKSAKLSALLDRLAAQHLKDGAPLVIDRMALRALDISADTWVLAADLKPEAVRPFWEKLGLVYVPCAPAALLTSPARVRTLGIQTPGCQTDLDDALQEAILHGHDASDGFFLVSAWLQLPAPDAGSTFAALPFPIADSLSQIQGATEWSIATDGQATFVYLIDSVLGRLFGWILAAAAGLLLWALHRRASPLKAFRALLLAMTIALLIYVWQPGAFGELIILPTMLVFGLGLIVALIRHALSRTPSSGTGDTTTAKKPIAGPAVAGVLLFAMAWTAFGQPVAERVYPVYLVDGKPPSVLVTPDLLAKLDQVEKQPQFEPRGAFLLGAAYAGSIKGELAAFEVEYAVHSFQDDATLIVPLAGVQLQEGAQLDGKPVFPSPHKNGYAFPVKGSGAHQLRVSFNVRISVPGDRADLRFTIPRLARNDMRIEWAAPVQALYCKHCLGAEGADGDDRKSIRSWHAHLGLEKDFILNWNGGSPTPKFFDVKEAHFWDLRPESPSLWTSLHYLVPKGTIQQCVVGLPEGMHVRNVDAAVLAATLPGSPVVVKDWQIVGKGGQRRVIVELAQPISGSLVLNLEIVPQPMARDKHLLVLPAPLQAKTVSGMLGYRLDAPELRVTAQNLAVQSMTPANFAQFWTKDGGRTVPQASHAYSLQRKAQVASLELVLQPNLRQAKGQLAWNVDLHCADFRGAFTFTSPRDDLMLLDFHVDPGLTIAEVAGPNVERWQVQNQALQIWLRQPCKQTNIDISGWHTTLFKGAAPAKQVFALPTIYPERTQLQETWLTIKPALGLSLEPATLKRVRRHLVDARQFLIEGVPYDASFQLRLDAPSARAVTLTKIQGSAGRLEIQHLVQLTTMRGRLPAVRLRLNDATPALNAYTMEAPGATVVPLKTKTPGEVAWTLTYPAGLPHEVYIAVRGHTAPDARVRAIELEGVRLTDSWLAWKDVELTNPATGKKPTSQKKVKDQIAAIANDRWSRDLGAWHAADAVRNLKATPTASTDQENTRVLDGTESACWRDGHWLHEASAWLSTTVPSEIRLQFPAPADSLYVLADRRSQAVWQLSERDFLLALDASAKPRLVELRWRYAPANESVETPIVGAVRINQAPLPSRQVTVYLPEGFAPAREHGPIKASFIERLLHDARVHMNLAAALAPDVTAVEENLQEITLEQQQFYSRLRQAEYALLVIKNAAPDFDVAASTERLNDLKNKNAALARERRYDDSRKLAEKAKRLSPPAPGGEMGAGLGTPLLLDGAIAPLLQTADARAFARQRTMTEWILIGAVLLLVMSYFRHGVSLTRWFAPELAIGLWVAGLVLLGGSFVGAIAIALLAMTRLVWLARALKRRVASAHEATPANAVLDSRRSAIV